MEDWSIGSGLPAATYDSKKEKLAWAIGEFGVFRIYTEEGKEAYLELPLNEVKARNHLCDRMFDLQSRVPTVVSASVLRHAT